MNHNVISLKKLRYFDILKIVVENKNNFCDMFLHLLRNIVWYVLTVSCFLMLHVRVIHKTHLKQPYNKNNFELDRIIFVDII